MTRLLPFILGTFAFLGIEVAFARPTFFVHSFAAVVVLAVASIWLISGRKITRRFLLLAGSQAILIASNFCFLLFMERTTPRHIMALSLSMLLFLIAEQLRFLRENAKEEISESIVGLLLLSYAATMLWASASFYGLRIFFGIPIAVFAAIIFLISFFFHRAIFINMKKDESESVYYRSIWLAIIATELFVAVYALPTSLAVDGALVAIPMAVFLNVYRLKIEERLEKNTLIKNMVFGAAALMVVLLTAEW